jgi:hypothetical protein
MKLSIKLTSLRRGTLSRINPKVTELTIRFEPLDEINDFEWITPLVNLEKLRVENWNGCKYQPLLMLPKLHTLELPDAKLSPYMFSFSDSLTRVELKSYSITFL